MSFYLSQFVIAFFGTLGFAMYFNCPKRVLPFACTFSGFVWLVFKYVVLNTNNIILAGFASAFCTGIIGEICARIFKTPALLFILPGLVPMIPGAGTYYTMYYSIFGNYEVFKSTFSETFFTLISLSLGVVASTGLVRIIVIIKSNILKRETT